MYCSSRAASAQAQTSWAGGPWARIAEALPWLGVAAAVNSGDRRCGQAGEWVGEDQCEARYSIWAPGEGGGEAHLRRASTVAGDSASEAHGGSPEGWSKAPRVRPASTMGRWRSSRTQPLVRTVAEAGR
jgi:hypothetical protein